MVGEGQERDEKEGLGGKEEGEMAVRMWIIINNKNHHHSNKKKLNTELYQLFLYLFYFRRDALHLKILFNILNLKPKIYVVNYNLVLTSIIIS